MRNYITTKVGVFAVYFGELPPYFQLWLNSCSQNSRFDWILLTDANVSAYEMPENVHYRPMTLEQFRAALSRELGAEIDFTSPMKVCDFRPMFWIFLDSEQQRYDFWGHCDLDVIFGRLDRYITDDLLRKHDKIFSVGHLTLYRNCELANEMFRSPFGPFDWRSILLDPRHRGFDEHIGVNRIWRHYRTRVFEDESLVADIDPAIRRFECVPPNINYRRQIFIYDRGQVLRLYWKGRWKTQEFMYIHFQKRKMVSMSNSLDVYAIGPSGFLDISASTSYNEIASNHNQMDFNVGESIHRVRRTSRMLRRKLGLGAIPL